MSVTVIEKSELGFKDGNFLRDNENGIFQKNLDLSLKNVELRKNFDSKLQNHRQKVDTRTLDQLLKFRRTC